MESSAVFEGAGAIKSPGSVDELLEDFVLDGIVGFDFVEETPAQQAVFRLLINCKNLCTASVGDLRYELGIICGRGNSLKNDLRFLSFELCGVDTGSLLQVGKGFELADLFAMGEEGSGL